MSTLSDENWLDLLRSNANGDYAEIKGRPLPTMPDRTVQLNTVGQAGPGAMEEAWAFAAECLARFRKSSRFSDPGKVLLDFGTGWGRIARCFLRDIPSENIIGVDVDHGLVKVCRGTFPGPRFLRCNAVPPLDFRNESIDFIVAYSVFSHLSEAACTAWVAEFARVLTPGGMVAVTTRGRWFFDHAASLTGRDSYSRALSTMFPDFDKARTKYDRGEFVHSNVDGVTGGGVLDGGFYGETFIPEQFAREVLSSILNVTEFYCGDSHPIIFFEKPAV
jgi:2-polyprenyl-3-methyl-5-hydroxy-6-metoxy-1,4-benzoquinol methylase